MSRKCPCCSGTFIREWIETELYTFYLCGDCGYAGTFENLSEDTLNNSYSNTYYQERYADTAALTKLRVDQYSLDIKTLNRYISPQDPPINVLDIGSGTGVFLGLLPGTHKYGVEINDAAVSNGEYKSYGAFVFNDVKQLPSDLKFDLISMRGVIEHLADPFEKLELVSNFLERNGTFYICATPDNDSPCAMVFREKWNQFCPPLHIHHFSRRSLSFLCGKHGLHLVGAHSHYLETPYADPASDGKMFQRACLDYPSLPSSISPAYPATMMSLIFKKDTDPSE